jgi:ubiquinone/menaquinone biosynthesis C-methylase UbiE
VDEKAFYDRSDAFQRASHLPAHPGFWRRLLNRHTEDRFERAIVLMDTGQSFLDVGCGDGRLAALAMRRYSKVNCIDITSTRLEEARDRCIAAGGLEQIGQFITANLNQPIPLPDASFDAIAAVSVLEHVFDVYSFVRDCRRLLKPDGVLVVEVPNVAYFKHRLRLLLGHLPITSSPHGWADGFGWDGGHLHYFTKHAVTELFTSEGFEVRKIVESRAAFASQRSRWVSLLAGNFLIKVVKSQ